MIIEKTYKQICINCKKENEVNGNQDLSKSNCFSCGKNLIELQEYSEAKDFLRYGILPKKKMDKDEQIVLLVDGVEGAIIALTKASANYKEYRGESLISDYYDNVILQLQNLIEKVKRE